MEKATRKQTKRLNRDLVLRTIFSARSISRANIARLTGLTPTTVSQVVSTLYDEGLIQEIGVGESNGGKPPILVSLNPDSRYTIGLNLVQKQFIGAVVNLHGEVKETVRVDIEDSKGASAVECVFQVISQLLAKQYHPIIGIGVGTPGLVDMKAGTVINSVNLDWKNLNLGEVLQQKFKLPILILNDSQATAIGEFLYADKNKNTPNQVVVNVDKGIGAGILINRKIFQGDGGGAGEIGHVVVKENGKLCRCGQRGCLETISSTSAVLEELQMKSIEEVQQALANGDQRVAEVIKDAAHYFAISLANLISVLNINEIILTGGMTRFGDAWLTEIRQTIDTSVFSMLSGDVSIKIGALGYQACILGASASLIMDNYNYLFLKGNQSNTFVD